MSRHHSGNSLIRALNVINTALIENRERCPWNQVVKAASSRLSGEKLVVAVEDDRNESDDQETFLVHLRNDRFCLVGNQPGRADDDPAIEKTHNADAADWKVTTRYLDDLACRATYYVQHPGRIGLEWLTDRLGISSPG
ncbi:MAG: hypothetical protein HQ518_26305 [Rhodopirellula sp.]|nr:hypothetical protein [Rhodopirellula sp.]